MKSFLILNPSISKEYFLKLQSWQIQWKKSIFLPKLVQFTKVKPFFTGLKKLQSEKSWAHYNDELSVRLSSFFTTIRCGVVKQNGCK